MGKYIDLYEKGRINLNKIEEELFNYKKTLLETKKNLTNISGMIDNEIDEFWEGQESLILDIEDRIKELKRKSRNKAYKKDFIEAKEK